MSFTSVLFLGITFAIVAGMMNGTFTLPMRYMGRWAWENVWALFIMVSCVIMPIVIVSVTLPGFLHVLASSPQRAVAMACVSGFAWGFGAIMFGQGISAVGISMGNTLVLAISASLGSFIPILLLAPERLHQPQGKVIILGTLIGIVGIACCGYAGFLKERSQKGEAQSTRGEMVGHARPFGIGLLLCTGSGLLSAVFNIGYSSAQPVLETAVRMGHSAFAGSNLIWLLMLTSGAVPNFFFCGYLFKKNGSWGKYATQSSTPLYLLAGVMGLLWGGEHLRLRVCFAGTGQAGTRHRVAAHPDHRLNHCEYLRIFDRRMETHPAERPAVDGTGPGGVARRDRYLGMVQHTQLGLLRNATNIQITCSNIHLPRYATGR